MFIWIVLMISHKRTLSYFSYRIREVIKYSTVNRCLLSCEFNRGLCEFNRGRFFFLYIIYCLIKIVSCEFNTPCIVLFHICEFNRYKKNTLSFDRVSSNFKPIK